MKKLIALFLILMFFNNLPQAQTDKLADSSFLITLNQQIDNLVVKQDVDALEKLYATDFVFSHGSGRVEGKQGWLSSVKKGSFISRLHDSVTVEMHPAIAIVKGKLSVQKKGKEKTERYHLSISGFMHSGMINGC